MDPGLTRFSPNRFRNWWRINSIEWYGTHFADHPTDNSNDKWNANIVKTESNALPQKLYDDTMVAFGCVYSAYYDIDTRVLHSKLIGIYRRWRMSQWCCWCCYLQPDKVQYPFNTLLCMLHSSSRCIASWFSAFHLFCMHFYLSAVRRALSRFFGNAIISTRHISYIVVCCVWIIMLGPFKASSFIVLSNMHECQMQASMHQETQTHTYISELWT